MGQYTAEGVYLPTASERLYRNALNPTIQHLGEIATNAKAMAESFGTTLHADGVLEDGPAMQTVLNQGLPIVFSRGTYLTSQGLTHTADVYGQKATFKASGTFSTTADVLTSTAGVDLEISGIKVDGSGRARWGINMNTGTNLNVYRNRVTGCVVGIRHASGTNDHIERNRVWGNTNQGIVEQGSVGQSSIHTQITDNWCWSNGNNNPTNLGWGINVSNYSLYFNVSGNHCYSNYQGGISIDLVVAGSPQTIQDGWGNVENNVITGFSGTNASHGISLNGAGYITVAGNTVISQAAQGIFANGRQCEIANNNLYNNTFFGIKVNGSGASGAFTNAPGFNVIGPNTYSGNGSGTLSADDSVILGTNRILESPTGKIVLGVNELAAWGGSPNIDNTVGGTKLAAWAMDSVLTETLIGEITVPDMWTHMRATLVWTNLGAGAGTALWRLAYKTYTDTTDLSGTVDNTLDNTPTAPAQNIAKETLLAANIATTPGRRMYIRIGRVAGSLGNDAGLLQLVLEPNWS